MSQRRGLVNKQHELSIRKQCELLSVHRSGLYYAPKGEKEENLEIMRLMDEYYLKHPTEGVIRVQDFLLSMSYVVNHKHIRRLLRLMGLMAIYPKKNLSKPGMKKYIYPYLLKGLEIDHPNHVWTIDITYIPMKNRMFFCIFNFNKPSCLSTSFNLSGFAILRLTKNESSLKTIKISSC